MNYAIRDDGLGWRVVAGADDCLPGETLASEPPAGFGLAADRRVRILAELAAIDARTPRAVREAVLLGNKQRLADLEAEAERLRSELADLD